MRQASTRSNNTSLSHNYSIPRRKDIDDTAFLLDEKGGISDIILQLLETQNLKSFKPNV